MSDQHQVAVCQRCGRGFMLTTTYRDFLRRRGTKVVTPVLCTTCFLKGGPLPKRRGKVKWFSPHKHYGFITTGEGEEVFFTSTSFLGATRYVRDRRPGFMYAILRKVQQR